MVQIQINTQRYKNDSYKFTITKAKIMMNYNLEIIRNNKINI